MSHIGSQVKRRQSQSYKFKKFAKIQNFWILKWTLHATHLLKLLDKMCKYEMDPMSVVEDTERTRFCPQTDGQGDTSIPPFQLRWSWGVEILWNFNFCLLSNIRCTSNIRVTLTFGNSQLKFCPTISLAKTSMTRRTRSFDSSMLIVDKVWSRPTWSQLFWVASDFDSPWITGPMTPHQSLVYMRHITSAPAAFSNAFSWMKVYKFQLKFHWSLIPWVQSIICQDWFW